MHFFLNATSVLVLTNPPKHPHAQQFAAMTSPLDSAAMTSPLDSAAITKANQDPPIVSLRRVSPGSYCHPSANSIAHLQNCLDIVATQGAYLVPRAGTPVFEKPYDAEFAAALEQQIGGLIVEQICRSTMYRGAADEWPIGHTPPEVREKRKAELKAQEDLQDATSDDGSVNDNDDNGISAGVGPGKAEVAPSQADLLPTPPRSVESPLATLHTKKRRRISKEVDDGETKRPTKTRVRPAKRSSTAENAVPNTSQGNGRKRRRILNMGDEEEESKGRPRPESPLLQRLRTRRLAEDVGEQEVARPTVTHNAPTTRKPVYKSSTPKGLQREETKRRRVRDKNEKKKVEERRNGRPTKTRVSAAAARAAARQAARRPQELRSRRPAD